MSESARTERQVNTAFVLSGPGLSIVLAALGISSATVTLPALSMDFPSNGFDPTLVVSAYILATTAFIVPIGRAGDIFGKRTVITCGLGLYTLGAIFAAWAPTMPSLIIGRFVQGAGAAAMMAMPLALVRDAVPAGQIGRWMGFMGALSAIGTASGPALGGIIAETFGWRAVHLLQAPLALVALSLCLAFVRERKLANAQSGIDLPGASALAISLAGFTFFVSSLTGGVDLTAILSAVVMLGAFVVFRALEVRSTAPIIPFDLMRSASLRCNLAMNAAVSLVMMGMLVVGPFFLMDGLGLTTAEMGLAMSVGPISSALSGVPAGRLTEKVGARQTVLVGASAMVGATAATATLPVVFGLFGFLLAFMLLAPSYQIFLAAVNTSVMENASEGERGLVSGLLNLSRNFGFILGTALVSSVFWLLLRGESGDGDAAQGVTFAMAGTFAVCCVLMLGVSFLAVIQRNAHPDT